MATVWHGVVNPPRPGKVQTWTYDDRDIMLRQGEEMGHFQLGSTVVLLWPVGSLAFDASCTAGAAVRMGQALGQWC
jgi:phosphatidylserine decarboxylase